MGARLRDVEGGQGRAREGKGGPVRGGGRRGRAGEAALRSEGERKSRAVR